MAASGPQVPHNDDDDAAFAEGAITLWANLLTLIGTHLRDTGMSREEMLGLLTMLGETNDENDPIAARPCLRFPASPGGLSRP